MKKTLSIILSLLMIISVLGAVPFSASATPSGGDCGENVKYQYNLLTHKLTISGSGAMYNYNDVDFTPPYATFNVEEVVVNPGVTSIGAYAFDGFTDLYTVSIAKSVTTIGTNAFRNCTILTADYEGRQTDWQTLTAGTPLSSATAFYGWGMCGTDAIYAVSFADETLTISGKGDIEPNADDAYAHFSDKISAVTINDGITGIGDGAFMTMSIFESISIPDSVTKIGASAFAGCANLTTVDGAEGVRDIGQQAFKNCVNLKSFDIPEGVTVIGGETFANCSSLESITIPDSLGTNLTPPENMGTLSPDAFDGASDTMTINASCQSVYPPYLVEGTNRTWNKVHTPTAAAEEDGYDVVHCMFCNEELSRTPTVISSSNNIKDAKITGIKSKTYTGNLIHQTITVKLGGKTLVRNTDYKLKYSKNKYVGTASVTITGTGKYKGSVKKTFRINPKATSISKLSSPKKGQLKIKWYKRTTQTSGYQIIYSTDSKFGTNIKRTVKGTKTTSKTLTKLKSKKRYYVQVRTYKTVNGVKYYSSWSKTKSYKIK